jgi:eukaryotic-like serine/threonine-protein kinase
MSSDYTEQQTATDEQRSKDLSLQRTRPPIEVPGYQTQRFIGAGAYGEVWAGVDRTTGRKVAIKFYLHRRGVDWSLLAREVEKLRFLSADRYVVQLLDVGWDAEPPYYVMEYIEHGSLDDLLRRNGTFTVPEAVELFREIAVGLAHAHGKGVVHCDLKPANILLDQDGKPRLADFGQSRLSHEQKPALGTLFYMAPEQADLEAVPDVRWDVYALGVILYTMLVGSPPHRNDGTVSHIDSAGDLADRLARYRHAIRAAPLAAEHRRVPGMDRALAEIIDRCLAVNPDDRFANVQEVLDALAARDRNRERLPMMVLGFLGPLLVLLVTAFFSYRGYARAVENAEQGYAQWALQNNKFAAELAAEKVTAQLSRYFEIARDEAENAAFRPLLFSVADGSQALERLTSRDTPDGELQATRAAFEREPQRRRLEAHLQERLDRYQETAARDPRAPRFASVFVTDRLGTQLAVAFDDNSPGESVGFNTALRTYFHGGASQGEQVERPLSANPPHIERTHLSAVFFSKSQRIWKIAVSTPIYREGNDGSQFEGILVLTVSLGDFSVSQAGGQSQTRDRFAVLVDSRENKEEEEEPGKILQHPLFEELASQNKSVPAALLGPKSRVPDNILKGEGSTEYFDPLGKYRAERREGDTPESFAARQEVEKLSQQFDRRWLAASAPVLPPIGAAETSQSGLVVVMQSDYQRVVEPARQLGRQFMRNSFAMFLVMVAVSLALWYIVVRLFREPRAGLNRPATPVPESTPIQGFTTIAAPRRK